MELVGLSKSTVYALIRKGEFPRPFKAGPQARRWSLREIEQWNAAQPRTDCAA